MIDSLGGSGFLYFALLVAIGPLILMGVILPFLRSKSTDSGIEPPRTLKFQLNKTERLRAKALLVYGILFTTILLLLMLYRQELRYLHVFLAAYFLMNAITHWKLVAFEEGKKLIFDVDYSVYEYQDGSRRFVFNHADIRKIVIHQYLFRLRHAKVADIFLEDRVIRISTALVNFERLPLFSSVPVDYKNYLIRVTLPATAK
ncbi:hypothetical protein [Pedobacter sp. SYSU D00535]|uniref:hypothetical protein n=1 Tax=Pedobacter sp. SYSU D00535 TaxID=2810308 RepID=UPI001A95D659|nr:hypothetical protein [Pedobacter sp. SYSU D00535]